jgi:hypothetical protein
MATATTAARPRAGRALPTAQTALFHHFMLRPTSVEGLVDTAARASEPQEFSFAFGPRPAHPLHDDGAGHHQDPHSVFAELWRAVRFAAHQYFRLPPPGPVTMPSATLELTQVRAWRRRSGAPATPPTLNLRITPSALLGGVPRILDCRADLLLGDLSGAVAEMRLVLPVAGPGPAARTDGVRGPTRRPGSAAAPALEPGEKPQPRLVGRANAANVVIGRCIETEHDGLTAQVFAGPGHPVFDGWPPDCLECPLLLEAARQVALLHTARLVGSASAYRILARWRAEFFGLVDPGAPLCCASAGHRPERDGWGRPVYRSTLTFLQGERPVGRIETAVLEDC